MAAATDAWNGALAARIDRPRGRSSADAAARSTPLAMHLALGTAGQPPLDAPLIAGIAAYRRHPYQRALLDPPVLWQDGSTRLLDYAQVGGKKGRRPAKPKRGACPPVLFVPSMINRAYVLDLAPGRSMLRWLAAQACVRCCWIGVGPRRWSGASPSPMSSPSACCRPWPPWGNP